MEVGDARGINEAFVQGIKGSQVADSRIAATRAERERGATVIPTDEEQEGSGRAGSFRSQSHSVRSVEKPAIASIAKPGLAVSDKDQTVPKVQELDKGDQYFTKRNLAVMRANTQRGFSGTAKAGRREAVSGVKAVGATK